MFEINQRDLRGLMDDIEDIVEDEIKNTVTTVHALATRNTAVDTGLARSNWQVTKDTPASNPLPIGSAQSNITRALALNYEVGKQYYITNPVDYVYFLNYGSSRRAGDFFVETSIRTALSRLNRSQ